MNEKISAEPTKDFFISMLTRDISLLSSIIDLVDNSVDEAISGYAEKIEVTLHKDGSISVRDDGRGMPVDKHPGEKISGVEVILTKLHVGGKFSNKNYFVIGI